MVTITEGNLLKAEADALVNTVNSVGHMGKGIALQFKKAFPENFKAYHRACNHGEVHPGKMFVFDTGSMLPPRYIINFPTKEHWRGKSKYEYIESGLAALVEEVERLGIQSIAVPPLGCGLGGLEWGRVRKMIEAAFETVPDVRVLLFAPSGAPAAEDMPIGTKHPNLTPARALILRMMDQYTRLADRLTLLEIQKMAYFLQLAGEPLRLKFEEREYGPYAANLNKVLEILEGHYTTGYGDRQAPDVEIALLPDAAEEAESYLESHPDALQRLNRVSGLIEGFETPYGMELLSSVHWVAVTRKPAPKSEDDVTALVHGWNERKHKIFQERHITLAWQRLSENGWIDASTSN